MIKIENLCKDFGNETHKQNVLMNCSLTINEGEMVAIMGTSGSGKSTLLNIMGLLDESSSGKVYLAGREVSKLNEKEKAKIRNELIGFVFQSFHLIPELNVQENVGLALQMRNIHSRVHLRRRKIKELSKRKLCELGMEEHMGKMPSQLSGGQKQRVAIARALVTNPKVILADEPTGSLDAKTSQEIMEVFHNLHNQGKTMLIITHDIEIAKQCGRVINLIDGATV